MTESKKPLALDAYEQLAEAYAAKIDSKPHNAYYERPATLSLLPDVNGLSVLDAGCGPGVYTEWLLEHGASVVAIDASTKMLRHAKKRVGNRAVFHQADLGSELSFLQENTFDLVLSALTLDYLPDWNFVFKQYHRILRPSGHFVFSVGHPFFDFTYFKTDDYFATEQVECEWRGFGVTLTMPSYRRPLSTLINTLLAAGFELKQLVEPKPTDEFKKADPENYQKLLHQPSFLCVKAYKTMWSAKSPNKNIK